MVMSGSSGAAAPVPSPSTSQDVKRDRCRSADLPSAMDAPSHANCWLSEAVST